MGQVLADILISKGVITKEYFYELLTRYFDVERADVTSKGIDNKVLRAVSEDVARQRHFIIFKEEENGTLDVAMEDPGDLETVEFLQRHLKRQVRAFLATPEDLDRGYSMYGAQLAEDFNKLIQDNILASLRSRARGIEERAVEVPIVAIIDNILTYGISQRASDIHLEVLEDSIMLRYRIDGVLREGCYAPFARFTEAALA